MIRKKTLYGILAFFAILFGKFFLKKKQPTTKDFDPTQYHGTWTFIDKNKQKQQLLVTETFDLSINGRSLVTELVELTPQQLVLRDQYGFYLILSYSDTTFYDESSDTSYTLTKQNSSSKEGVTRAANSEK
ncbi:hypothetical protein IGJ18_000815 [Enterococcus sp. AZ078]|uniref:DUF4828 domain-containing protein n=1 Tax=Enterococcus sp. AZ078 TaxID=2774710 RepID=UPI003F1ECEE8